MPHAGGRILQLSTPDGVPVDLGGEFIHGTTENLLWDLACEQVLGGMVSAVGVLVEHATLQRSFFGLRDSALGCADCHVWHTQLKSSLE